MARPTDYYCDPAGSSDAGAGTIGDPWTATNSAVIYSLLQITRDGTNGDVLYIKSGANDVLTERIDTNLVSNYGTPTITAPLIFRGYDAAADDGGIGVIDGNATYGIYNSNTIDGVFWVDLRLTNTASGQKIISGDNYNGVINCRLDTSDGIAIDLDTNALVINNYITDCTGSTAITVQGNSFVYGNHISSGISGVAISASSPSVICHNIVNLTTTNTCDGIDVQDNAIVFNNSVFSVNGTGEGIRHLSSFGIDLAIVFNNIVEGFKGAGGDGFWSAGGTNNMVLHGYNATFNNTNNSDYDSSDYFFAAGGNDIPLAASPFATPGSDDFAVGTEVKAVGFPNFIGGGITPLTSQFFDMGAAQREEPAGGGGVKMAGDSGGMVG